MISHDSRLAAFLADQANSVSREFLLTSRLTHDLIAAAAARGYDLGVYLPAVDRDGFDLIVDDRDTLLPLQLKSFIGRTATWEIHRRLLRPARHYVSSYGFESSPRGEGLGGGVVLIEVKAAENTVTLNYLYTDVNVLSAFWLGVVSRPASEQRVVMRLREELEADPSGKVTLTKSAFLRPRSPEHLLALAGLQSRFDGVWPSGLVRLAKHDHANEELPAPREVLMSQLAEELRELCSDYFLQRPPAV